MDKNPVEGDLEITIIGEIAKIMPLSMPKDKSEKAALDKKTACSVSNLRHR